jgi:hypothetical protein
MLDHSCQVQRSPLSERRGDCYDTPPVAALALVRVETFLQQPRQIWEPCCGVGNIVWVLREAGHHIVATGPRVECDAIVTNPPFMLAEEFVATALERAPVVMMLLRLAFYESERRSEILENCGLARIHVFRKRLPMMHREGWEGRKSNSGMAFAWYVYDQTHVGPTTIDRISWEK